MAAELFPSDTFSALFREFGGWLGNEVGIHKAAITLNKYLPFFRHLSSLGASIPEYTALLTCFTTLGLRRNLLPMRFLQSTKKVVVDEESKRNSADHTTIKKIIGKFETGSRARELLDLYHSVLLKRLQAGRIKPSSIRMALSPAASLLVAATVNEHGLPTQKDLVSYFKKTPGQRAALSGFVCFLRDSFHVELELPKPQTQDGPKKRKALEKELMGLIAAGAKEGKDQQKLIEVALRYLHRIPLGEARKMARGNQLVKTKEGDMAILNGQKHYWLPKDLIELLDGPASRAIGVGIIPRGRGKSLARSPP